ncbi:MAG TPA: DUF3857 domain-containing protein [Segetibacter sp.]|nr:DUF3857 domain-containing protein [Segetibacter sp.]
MRNKLMYTLLLVHLLSAAFSQPIAISSYSADAIPEELKKNAHAVYRLDEAVLEIASPSKYTLQVHQITTVLNSEGAQHLQQSLWFDKFNKISEVDVKLYNKAGTETQHFKKKDFTVQSYYDGISLATDDKMMSLSLAAADYPCTIDISYSRDVTGYIDLPNWYMNNATSSVEQFRYIVKVPSTLDIRHRTRNVSIKPAIEDNGKQKTYTWEAKNVPVLKVEAGGYDASNYLPQVLVSPNVFEYDGYKGEFDTWSNFGKWSYTFYEEKNAFSEQRAKEIKSLVDGLPDKKSKVKVLYDYLQKNMRYVSIQFGIGGFKPFNARFVDEKKYGDCKALTNYMRSLLSVAGIQSYPALINAGYNKVPVSPEFPESVFNHVILCVPNEKDSTWLECTSTTNEAGFLGSFTENKNALLLTEKGGIIVPTPKSNFNENVLETVNNIFVSEDGAASVKGQIKAQGSFDQLLHYITHTEKRRQTELFVQYLDYKIPDEFAVVQNDALTETKTVEISAGYQKLYDFKAGDKYFFPASISRISDEKLPVYSDRKSDYLFEAPYTKIDTTIFHLPASFKPDDIPTNKEFSEGPVYYSRKTAFDETTNTIKIISVLQLKTQVIPAVQYKSVSELFQTIEREEVSKLVLKK